VGKKRDKKGKGKKAKRLTWPPPDMIPLEPDSPHRKDGYIGYRLVGRVQALVHRQPIFF
jgi:hypothetical protein